MPRTAVVMQTMPVAVGAPGANSLDKTFTACDVANLNQVNAVNGREIYTFKNSHASTPYTFTITSVPDSKLKRSGDIGPYTLAAGVEAQCVLPGDGFRQADGSVYFAGSNAAVVVNITKIPDTW